MPRYYWATERVCKYPLTIIMLLFRLVQVLPFLHLDLEPQSEKPALGAYIKALLQTHQLR